MDRAAPVRVAGRSAPPLGRARTWIVVTQVVFFASVGICLVVAHGPSAQTDGISYYGVHPATLPLLVLAYLIAAVGLWRVGPWLVASGAPVAVRTALRALAVGLVALLATPYTAGTFFNWAHMTVGVMMALVQIALAVWLLARERSAPSAGAFAVVLGGGLVAAISLPDWHVPLLLVGEVFFEVGFAWFLVELVATLRHLAGETRR
jgi:hypothetical protein